MPCAVLKACNHQRCYNAIDLYANNMGQNAGQTLVGRLSRIGFSKGNKRDYKTGSISKSLLHTENLLLR